MCFVCRTCARVPRLICLLPPQANEVLGWSAKLGLDEMCRDAWKWQADNPDGFPDTEVEL